MLYSPTCHLVFSFQGLGEKTCWQQSNEDMATAHLSFRMCHAHHLGCPLPFLSHYFTNINILTHLQAYAALSGKCLSFQTCRWKTRTVKKLYFGACNVATVNRGKLSAVRRSEKVYWRGGSCRAPSLHR